MFEQLPPPPVLLERIPNTVLWSSGEPSSLRSLLPPEEQLPLPLTPPPAAVPPPADEPLPLLKLNLAKIGIGAEFLR